MKYRLSLILAALPLPLALALPSAALAQATYPTAAPGVRVAGSVPLQCNASNAACAPVTAANPQPVTVISDAGGGLTDAQLRASAVPVSAASLPLPSGAATEATLAAASGKLPTSLGIKTAAGSLSIAPASDALFMAIGPVAIDAPSSANPLPSGCIASASNYAGVGAYGDALGFWCDGRGSAGVFLVAGHGGEPIPGNTKGLLVVQAGLEYETVAASQSAQALGATGATGDLLSYVLCQPTSVAPGVVTILDNAIEVHAYPGGTVAADLKPFEIHIGAASVSGAWKITTGANIKCTGYGDFT